MTEVVGATMRFAMLPKWISSLDKHPSPNQRCDEQQGCYPVGAPMALPFLWQERNHEGVNTYHCL